MKVPWLITFVASLRQGFGSLMLNTSSDSRAGFMFHEQVLPTSPAIRNAMRHGTTDSNPMYIHINFVLHCVPVMQLTCTLIPLDIYVDTMISCA